MIIVPYYMTITKVDSNLVVYKVTILCQGGEKPWEEDDQVDIENDILHENDLVAKSIFRNDNVVFIEIDRKKTNLANMYNWDEIPKDDKDTLCWRQFVAVKSDNELWLPFSESAPQELNILLGS
jgi:hypothetical protein